MIKYLFAFILLASPAFADCPAAPVIGIPKIDVPSVDGKNTTDVCHEGYEALVDNDRKVPLWVAYHVTGKHILMACGLRGNQFHADPALPDGAKPKDYLHSHYDMGHQAPAQDFAWSKLEERDSFSMANMAPQTPKLNRAQWERLEETVRSWAYELGNLDIFVGPVFDSNPKTIHGVAVPIGFWKVIVNNGHTIAFYMRNVPIKKGDLTPYLSTVEDVENLSGLKLPVGDGDTVLWPIDLKPLKKAHAKACHGRHK